MTVNLELSTGDNSKVYTVTTDSDGVWTLPINLNTGNYTAVCTYDGTNIYDSSSTSATITVL